jgi:hypothetical protein
MHQDDVCRAIDEGVDGIVVSTLALGAQAALYGVGAGDAPVVRCLTPVA